MLTEKIIQMLNNQINLEFYSSNMYLQISSWCSYNGLEGCEYFFKKHATEELEHMQKLFDYINESGSMAIIDEVKKPPQDFKDLHDVLTRALAHEQYVTKSINELVDYALTNKDYITFNFLQWYLEEQHEEEVLFKKLLSKCNANENNSINIYLIDKAIRKLA